MRKNERLSCETKVLILREHLQNNVPISELAEQYNIHPNVIFNWRKRLFEGAVDTFSGKHKKNNSKQEQEKGLMEKKLIHKDRVIAKLTEEILSVKKNIVGKDSEGLGWRPI